MKNLINLVSAIIFILIAGGCNTLYNFRTINIETMEPGKFFFPESYRTVAVRYNNSNVSFNPEFEKYFENSEVKSDTFNIDSLASEIYFDIFLEYLNRQHFFDTIVEINRGDYSSVIFSGSLFFGDTVLNDTNDIELQKSNHDAPKRLNYLLKNYPPKTGKPAAETKILDPKYGLYTKDELQKIADTTNAGLLMSLDFFTSVDGINIFDEVMQGYSVVYNLGFWNFYDLKKAEPAFFYYQMDTVSWVGSGNYKKEIINSLPPRRDAILNAADISGAKFADHVVPHWTETDRLYYCSGHLEIKKTEAMIKNGNWLEAAKIWKANISNPNKNIAAKSMFNLGLACEMEGNLDAAIDWVVKSYYVFGNKNAVHSGNCTDYLSILGQRKLDIKKIEIQQNPEMLPKNQIQ